MLPASFSGSSQFGPTSTAIGPYALIPELAGLPPHLRSEVQAAFARSLAVLWQVLLAVCAVGAVASLFMRGLPLTHAPDIIEHGDKDQGRAEGQEFS